MERTRDNVLDILKGLLIIFVVMGHYDNSMVHEILFWFHMPVFFIISGLVFNENDIFSIEYLKKIFSRYIIPYLAYYILIWVIFDRTDLLKALIIMFYGGRITVGVFWYPTCLFLTLLFFALIKRYVTEKHLILIAITLFVVSAFQSRIYMLYPKIGRVFLPWGVDLLPITTGYVTLGYSLKLYLRHHLLEIKYAKIAWGGITMFFSLIVSILIYGRIYGVFLYNFDIKQLEFINPILSLVIPVIFFVVLYTICMILNKNRVSRIIIGNLGRNTMPIMFLHMFVNEYIRQIITFGLVQYCVFGILIPVMFTICIAATRSRILKKLFAINLNWSDI